MKQYSGGFFWNCSKKLENCFIQKNKARNRSNVRLQALGAILKQLLIGNGYFFERLEAIGHSG